MRPLIQRHHLVDRMCANLEWQGAHNIVKDYDDPFACWIHAVLHKIEGDAGNSRYWYTQTAYVYDDFADAWVELVAIREALGEG